MKPTPVDPPHPSAHTDTNMPSPSRKPTYRSTRIRSSFWPVITAVLTLTGGCAQQAHTTNAVTEASPQSSVAPAPTSSATPASSPHRLITVPSHLPSLTLPKAVVLPDCRSFRQQPEPPPADIVITLETGKHDYALDELVTFTIHLKNTGSSAANYTTDGGKAFDILAKFGVAGIWLASSGYFYTQAEVDYTLEAGQEKTWSAQWRQDVCQEGPDRPITYHAPPGTYTAVGVTGAGPRWVSNTVTFTIGS